jgi:hypothetical protein
VGVLLVRRGQRTEAEVLRNGAREHARSPRYAAFVGALGWEVHLARHQHGCFGGGLDRSAMASNGHTSRYWSDSTAECMFHVGTMMPTRPERGDRQVDKKRHIGNDFVLVVWSEQVSERQRDTACARVPAKRPLACCSSAHRPPVLPALPRPSSLPPFLPCPCASQLAEYEAGIFRSQFNRVKIVVHPLPPTHAPCGGSGAGMAPASRDLYRVRIIAAAGLAPFGPLLDGMVVCADVLAPLVRQTALEAYAACREQIMARGAAAVDNGSGGGGGGGGGGGPGGLSIAQHPYEKRRTLIAELVDNYTVPYDDETMLRLFAPAGPD